MDVALLGFGVLCAVGGVFVMALAHYMMATALDQYDAIRHSWRPNSDYRFGTCHRWIAFARQFGSPRSLVREYGRRLYSAVRSMACGCLGWVMDDE